jgi:predicted metalloprotease with PDZ domain
VKVSSAALGKEVGPRILLKSILFIVVVALPVSAQDRLTYRVNYSTSKPDVVHIAIQPAQPLRGPLTLIIPRAITSGYSQRFYDRYVESVSAVSTEGKALKIERQEGSRWSIADRDATVSSIEYDVNLARMEQEITSAADASKRRPEYVGLLGYSVFGFLEGKESASIQLEVRGPDPWPIFTTLAPKSPADKSVARASARDFYALADSQIAMGPRLNVRRLEAPVPLFLVSYVEAETDLNKHGELFADAFRKVISYFGSPPFDHYTAQIEMLKPLSEDHSYGFSMEHRDSSTYFLGVDRVINSNTTRQQLETERFNFAHHIVHSWIPKRCYGTGYLPFNWELAPLIDTIWFNEGFARFITSEALTEHLPEKEAQEIRKRRSDLLRQTIAGMPEFIRKMPLVELSRVGSLMYSEDFRTGRTLFAKGALMAEEIDVMIRQKTSGKKRLRDSLQAMMSWSRKSERAFRLDELPGLIGAPVGVDEKEIKAVIDRWLQ